MSYEKNCYVSDLLNAGVKGHVFYGFADIVTNNDNLLFIDPLLLEINQNGWHKEANAVVKSFFDSFFSIYKDGNSDSKHKLLEHAGEQNGTRLGYGSGSNGKGSTAAGLLKIFRPFDTLLSSISTLSKPEDLTVLLPSFAEDGLSDLLTNILHDELNKFTVEQLNKYGKNSNGIKEFWTWDRNLQEWKKVNRPSFFVLGKELLLVPKDIVRQRYLFSTSQYFNRIILERMREEGGGYDEKGRLIPKKEIVRSKRFTGAHWQYDAAVEYTKKYDDALHEYHEKLPIFYGENGGAMTDKELDDYLYNNALSEEK